MFHNYASVYRQFSGGARNFHGPGEKYSWRLHPPAPAPSDPEAFSGMSTPLFHHGAPTEPLQPMPSSTASTLAPPRISSITRPLPAAGSGLLKVRRRIHLAQGGDSHTAGDGGVLAGQIDLLADGFTEQSLGADGEVGNDVLLNLRVPRSKNAVGLLRAGFRILEGDHGAHADDGVGGVGEVGAFGAVEVALHLKTAAGQHQGVFLGGLELEIFAQVAVFPGDGDVLDVL